MRNRDTLALAAGALRVQSRRTLLIVLATAIGVAAVLLLTALGDGARHYVIDEFSSLGTRLIVIIPGRNETVGGPPPLLGETPRSLTLADAAAAARHPLIGRVAPVMIGEAPVSTPSGLEREVMILGSTNEIIGLRHLELAQGRGLPAIPPDRAAPACVLGDKLKRELFGTGPALGSWVRIGDRRFRVVGLFAPVGTSLGDNLDDLAIIPVASAQQIFDREALFRILTEPRGTVDIDAAAEALKQVIAARHEGEQDVTVITQDSVLKTFDRILNVLTLAVAGISAISLFVAGILVMNVMLVAVAQRRAEIGLLKALGATLADIRNLFLLEAVLLCLGGGAAGTIVGYGGTLLVRVLYPKFPAAVPAWGLAAGLATAFVAGLVFGVGPARRAARLDPVEALAKR
ncbi:MAG: ABC transporter permease [Gammaproteobacteria bacterium]|nr:ABC transporter permease [Gammaproteobacteria bacterium]